MKNKINFALLLALFMGLCYACDKDESFLEVVDNVPQPITKVSATIYGLILDDSGTPIVDASISTNELQTTSDENGYFSLTGLFDQNGTNIKAQKEGYVESHGTVLPVADGALQLKFTLIEKVTTEIGNTSGKISYEGDNMSILFQEAGFKHQVSDEVYEGTVVISATYFNPLADKFSSYFPGYLKTINNNNTELIQPYGLVNVELFGEGNELLQLNKTAIISIAIPADLLANAPDELSLWYFDTQAAHWIEDGVASRKGNFYEGEVSHFTDWCVGFSTNFDRLTGKITKNNIPYANARVGVVYPNKFTFNGSTDENGNYSISLISGEIFEIKVLDQCNNILHQESGGVASGDQVLDVNITSSTNAISVQGTLFNCENEIIPAAYVLLNFDDTQDNKVLKTDENGQYQGIFEDCNATSVSIKGYDAPNGLISEATVITGSGTYDIIACETTFSGEMTIQITDGETYVINDVVITIMDSPHIPNAYLYTIITHDNFGDVPGATDEFVTYKHGIHVNKDPNPQLPAPPYAPLYQKEQSDNPPVIYDFPAVGITINELTEDYMDVTLDISGFAKINKYGAGLSEENTGVVRIKANVVQ